ncbi:MAG: TRAP transporter large permease subunit [Anaerolineae bacterium]|nr:TRAP transporter large permease subunit [Anaerolineae bacterium]MCO5189449.1 TRAP transporter large permease subunit [Anaerolineae bacterium]MCO5195596.1 TRAP transporter large permease subunit [Anaerolineae bacterium]MCO5197283.1 TRAP transporter large permease subunit [Anaerolineae bacterium]MCO5204779.1 TRAP transporter large permease subunit [Anaerolineae bacterium]
MSWEWLAIVMFVLFLILILSGYPVAYSFAGTAIVFGALGLSLGAFDLNLLKLLPNRWFGAMSDFTLLAIPFFVFMGAVFEKSGLAERLLNTIGILLGPLPGGLALATVIVGTLLAAATGVVAATVIVMGLLSLPIMVRYRYDHKLATGAITASGTLAQLLPPSLVLVVLSSTVGVPVGDLFLGALIPGLVLAGLYGAYVLIRALLNPEMAPALPPEARTLKGWALARETLIAVVPPVILIFAVLGSIFAGIATPTEAGAVGAAGACVLAIFNRNFNWQVVKGAARSTSNITALVLMILFCSSFFALVFDGLGGQRWVTNLLTGLPGGYWGFIIFANIAVFLLGINLEFLEISFIVMPLFVPAAELLGVNMVWFSVMMAINLNMAFISPPVGFSLFYLQSVAPPEVDTLDIHRGALPFMGLQGIGLVVVMLVPATVLWLVNLSG